MRKVLIIEDNDVALSLVRAGLRNDPGWEIMFATDGERGLALALQHLSTLDAVVLDLYLPKLDGHIVLDRIRAAAPTLPIVVVSADPTALAEMQQRGATITLPKPVSGEKYAQILHALIPRQDQAVAIASTAYEPSFDRRPVPRMHLLDLDLSLIQNHINKATESRRYDGPAGWQEFLLVNGGAVEEGETLRPTIAGALVFAQRPERWLIASGVDVAEFTGQSPDSRKVRFQQPIRGNIFSVIERTVDLLWARIDHVSPLDPVHGVSRIQEDAYPQIVLRELTVNALCHRDWSQEGSVVRIQLFPNRIEWISPGGLPPGVTVQKLREAQLARNPALAQLLYQAGVIERFGLGIDSVLDALQSAGHPSPEMEDQGMAFLVRAFGIPVGHNDASTTTAPRLTKEQQRILTFLANNIEHKASDIAQEVGYSVSSAHRDLKFLIGLGLVIGSGEARARRYRRGE